MGMLRRTKRSHTGSIVEVPSEPSPAEPEKPPTQLEPERPSTEFEPERPSSQSEPETPSSQSEREAPSSQSEPETPSTQFEPIIEEVTQPALDQDWEFEDVNGKPGHLKSIRMINFMCHDNFYFEFSPRVNVIHGENGSGKSAITTAVGLIFGLRAASTNRADRIEDAVKKGSNVAAIELEICNYIKPDSESRGYKPELYGKVIKIERTILLSGGGSVVIKNGATNKIVSRERRDVQEIAAHFRIKVENPATILNQEISKHFLNSKNPSDKYRFYMRATEIENIHKNYLEAKQSTTRQYDIYHQRMQILSRREQELDDVRQKHDLLKKYDQKNESIDDLKSELEWAHYYEASGAMGKLKKDVENKVEDLEKQETNNLKIQERMDVIIADFEKKKEEQSAFEEESEKLKIEMENLKGDTMQVEKEARTATVQYQAQKNEVRNLEAKRQELEETRSKALGENNSNYEAELERIDGELNQKNLELIEIKNEMADLKTPAELQDAAREIENSKDEWARMRGQKVALERSIQELSNSGNKQVFGRQVETFIAEIDKIKGRLQGRVYGPLAKYIKLNNQENAPIVEKVLRASLTAFLVTNRRDYEEIKKIHDRLFRNGFEAPRLAQRQSTPRIDLTGKCAQYSFYNSIWELFTIEETDVANYIIDNHNPNTLLYIPDHNKAYDEASRRGFENECHNVKQIFSKSGDQIMLNPFRTYPPHEKDRFSRFLVTDNREQIRYEKSKLEGLGQRITDLEVKQKELIRALDNERKERVNKEKKKNGLQGELRNLESRKQGVEDKIEKLRSTDFEEMERKLAIINERLEEERTLLKQYHEQVTQLKEAYREQNAKFDEAKFKYTEHLNSNNFEAFSKQFRDRQAKFDKKMQEIQVEIQLLTERKVNAEKAVEAQEFLINQLKEKASKLCPVKPDPSKVRTVPEVKREIADYESFLRNNNDIVENADQIREDFQRCNFEHDREKKNFQECVELHNTFSLATKRRKHALDAAKQVTQKKVNYFFKEFLKEKRMKGKIAIYEADVHDPNDGNKIIHKAETLEVIAHPASSTAANYDPRSLSGGERSFSTVSFIVALWNVASTPFRILDEVDVFMDAITRRMCLEMLISFATNKSCDQFVFLSPLNIPDLLPSPKVKIFKMPVVQRH